VERRRKRATSKQCGPSRGGAAAVGGVHLDVLAVPLSQWLKKVLLVLEGNFIVLSFGHLFEEDYL
jgi:hypothetical protein